MEERPPLARNIEAAREALRLAGRNISAAAVFGCERLGRVARDGRWCWTQEIGPHLAAAEKAECQERRG